MLSISVPMDRPQKQSSVTVNFPNETSLAIRLLLKILRLLIIMITIYGRPM